MNARGATIGVLRGWIALCTVLAVSACSVGPGKDISSTKPYADLIGARYTVISHNLYAYGVYESLDDKKLSYVTLIPHDPVGVGGLEFAFRRGVPSGQVVRILSAWRRPILSESGVYYLVDMEHSDLPEGIPIRLELFRGNEGEGANLNPAVYRKLQ